jgi:hypothetical protein
VSLDRATPSAEANLSPVSERQSVVSTLAGEPTGGVNERRWRGADMVAKHLHQALLAGVTVAMVISGCAADRTASAGAAAPLPSSPAAIGSPTSTAASTAPAAAATASTAELTVKYLAGNTVAGTDESRIRLAAPPGTAITAATEIAGGFVFSADDGFVYLQARDGSRRRVGAGQFTVSPDGTRLAVMSDVTVSVYALPDLLRLGAYAVPGATPGGPSAIGVNGDWVLLFDADQPSDGPGVTVVWNVTTHASVRLTGVYPLTLGTGGDVLQRALTASGRPCYALAAERHGTGATCAPTARPAGGVDSGALSPDGRYAAISVSNRIAPVVVHTADLRAGRWKPITLPVPSGTPVYWAGMDVVIGGDATYRCSVTARCARLPIPPDAAIVPYAG